MIIWTMLRSPLTLKRSTAVFRYFRIYNLLIMVNIFCTISRMLGPRKYLSAG